MGPLAAPGVPLQDASRYVDAHHSQNDTVDPLDAAGLRQNVAVYATAVWIVTNWPGPIGRLRAEPPK